MLNVFIVFVKILGWIVSIWVKLVRLIGEKREPNYNNEIYNNYIK